jgi:DMSO reductase anchor subunit
MNENFTSLVLFTVLSQTAAGSLIFRELIMLKGRSVIISEQYKKWSLPATALLLFISLAIAFLHLGNPLLAFNAVNNIGRSWLSREIFFLSLLLASLLPYMLISLKNKKIITESIFSAIVIILCISLIYSMIKLYMIPGIISWNTPFTPLSFIITSLLCGIVLQGAFIGRTTDRFRSIMACLIAVLIIVSLTNSVIFQGAFLKQAIYLFIIRTCLSIIALLITAIRIFRTQTNKTLIWWVILLVMVIGSEIINRYLFFLSFEKSGL